MSPRTARTAAVAGVLLAVAVAAGALGCKKDGPVATPGSATAPTATPALPVVPPPQTAPGGGWMTPDDVARAYVLARNERNAEALAKLFPPEATILASLSCPGANPGLESMNRERAAATERLGTVPEGTTWRWIATLDADPPRSETLAKGTPMDTCTTTMEMSMARIRSKILESVGGESNEETVEMSVVRAGPSGGWYLMGL